MSHSEEESEDKQHFIKEIDREVLLGGDRRTDQDYYTFQ